MKKVYSKLLIIMMLMLLAGCTNTEGEGGTNGNNGNITKTADGNENNGNNGSNSGLTDGKNNTGTSDNDGNGKDAAGNTGGTGSTDNGGSTDMGRFAKDATITYLKWNHRGTAMEPYYIVRTEDGGCRWLISYDEENPENGTRVSNMFTSEGDLKKFSDALIAAGIVKWDGFSKSSSLGDWILDGDDGFTLEIMFSDGNTMTASGYNSFPENYSEVVGIIMDTFRKHEDYSGYYPTELPADAEMTRISIKIGSPFALTNASGEKFNIELSTSWKKWIITLSDPRGRFLEKGTYINEYDDTEKSLHLEDYAKLLDKYGMFALNQQTEDYDFEKGDQYIDISGSFDNGKELMIRKNVTEEEYKDFITEFITMTYEYYNKMK